MLVRYPVVLGRLNHCAHRLGNFVLIANKKKMNKIGYVVMVLGASEFIELIFRGKKRCKNIAYERSEMHAHKRR